MHQNGKNSLKIHGNWAHDYDQSSLQSKIQFQENQQFHLYPALHLLLSTQQHS